MRLLPFGLLARKIWRQFAYKQLPLSFSNHFWKGGTGKWEKYFKPAHLLYLQQYGIEDVLQAYGYSDELARFKMLVAAIPGEAVAAFTQEQRAAIPVVKNYYRDEQYATATFLRDTNGDANCVELDEMTIVATDDATRANVSEVLNNPYLKTIIAAGAQRDNRLY